MNPKDHDVARPFCVDACPSVHLTSSLKKYLDPSLASLFAKCCNFYCVSDFFFSGFSFSLDILYSVCQGGKERKASSRTKVRNSQGALKLCCRVWNMSASLSYSSLFGFFVMCLSLPWLFVYFWDSRTRRQWKFTYFYMARFAFCEKY